MRITDVRSFTLSCALPRKLGGAFRHPAGWTRRETLLVRIETDAGLVGWGESFALPAAGGPIIRQILAPLLLGEEVPGSAVVSTAPPGVALWERLYFGLGYGGVKGTMVEALSGVDLALWDLRGKAEGRSASALLAEALGTETVRSRVACYATGLYYEPLDDLLAEARSYVDQGFRDMKMKIGLGLEEDLARVAAVRRAIGSEVRLKVDANCGFDLDTVREMEHRLREYEIDWLEEPLIVEDIQGYRSLREGAGIRIAAGEGEYTRWGFRELLPVVDVAQPDVIRAGGLTETAGILRMAAEQKVPIAPHAWSGALCLAASLHVAAVAPTFEVLEYDRTPNPLRDALVREPFDYSEGTVAVPQGPGLGVEPDPEAVLRYVTAVY